MTNKYSFRQAVSRVMLSPLGTAEKMILTTLLVHIPFSFWRENDGAEKLVKTATVDFMNQRRELVHGAIALHKYVGGSGSNFREAIKELVGLGLIDELRRTNSSFRDIANEYYVRLDRIAKLPPKSVRNQFFK